MLAATAFMQSSQVAERLFLELLYRKYLWYDLPVHVLLLTTSSVRQVK